MDFTSLISIFKTLGTEVLVELAKNKWIQFCIGAAVLMAASPRFIEALAAALR